MKTGGNIYCTCKVVVDCDIGNVTFTDDAIDIFFFIVIVVDVIKTVVVGVNVNIFGEVVVVDKADIIG